MLGVRAKRLPFSDADDAAVSQDSFQSCRSEVSSDPIAADGADLLVNDDFVAGGGTELCKENSFLGGDGVVNPKAGVVGEVVSNTLPPFQTRGAYLELKTEPRAVPLLTAANRLRTVL